MEKGNKSNSKRNRPKFDIKKKFGVKPKSHIEESKKIKAIQQSYREIDSTKLVKFDDFPLSERTKKGLKALRYESPTKIQQESIGLALQGHDILGAAKTGSGKTLAFVVPVLEHLYCQKWSAEHGLGALIISPTRELAYQIFDVLRKVGKFHDFSAGLVIGGKFVREEAERINNTNIVICTPGRLLQHMDETAYFNADNLKILVLDEADRILDLGFQQTMNAIIQNLPPERQTLLFSATQTKSVKDLARLSLKDPMYVSVHENAQHSTPTQLEQSYIVCNVEDKFSLVWSFVKNHLKSKILIFMASCKQVRFIHEVFRRIRPGVPVMALHGAMPQLKRMAVYDSFVWKQHACMFATDIAARGLDFPAVNWVIQLDCPEDANTYIHRAGRTARYEKDGEALLILLPTEEEAMIGQLQTKKIPINKIKVNPRKQRSIQGKIESLLAADVQLKEFAQRAFVSYLKSVFFMKNKSVFDVTAIHTDEYASSLGLAITPRVRFIEKEKKLRETQARKTTAAVKSTKSRTVPQKTAKNTSEDSGESSASSEDDDSSESDSDKNDSDSDTTSSDDDSASEDKLRARLDLKDTGFSFTQEANDDDDDDDLLKVKRSSESQSAAVDDEIIANTRTSKISKGKSKYAVAKKILKKQLQVNTKVTFNEEGEEQLDGHRKQQMVANDDERTEGGIDISKARLRLANEDKLDKKIYRQKIQKKHREEKIKEKERKRKEKLSQDDNSDEEMEVILGDPNAASDDHDSHDDSGSADDSESDDSRYEDSRLEKMGRGDLRPEMASDDDWNSEDYSDIEESSAPPKKKKKKMTLRDIDSADDSDSESGTLGTVPSLADDELLALKLLQS